LNPRLCAQPGRYVVQCSFIIEHRYTIDLALNDPLDGRRCRHCGEPATLTPDRTKLGGIRDAGQKRGRDLWETYKEQAT